MTFTRKDLGIGALKANLVQLARTKVLGGVQGPAAAAIHPNGDVAVGLIAFWLHFGTRSMPPRPYVDHAISMISERVPGLVKRAVSSLVDGRASSVAQALAPAGEALVASIKQAIDDSRDWATPLSDATIKAKGHDQPLFDTGTVRDATSYTIRDGDTTLSEGT